MKTNALHFKRVSSATIVAFALCAGVALPVAASNDAAAPSTETIVVAQAATTVASPGRVVVDAFPASQAGVRAAAAQGPDALRHYIWRTRGIYNFSYQDFAPRV